jgi:hypothetical protein
MADGDESMLSGGTPRREIYVLLKEVYLEKECIERRI